MAARKNAAQAKQLSGPTRLNEGTFEYKGYQVRPGWRDRYTVDEVKNYRSLEIGEGDVFLDIGGNIGSVAKFALEAGAKKVISVEPDPGNFELLEKNAAGAVLLNAAAIAVPRKVTLYLGARDNAIHSILPVRGRDGIEVRTEIWSELLAKYQPNKIKMDCEGAEYELLAEPLPNHVKAIILEFHLQRKGQRELGQKLAASLAFQFQTIVREPKIGSKSWVAIGSYRR